MVQQHSTWLVALAMLRLSVTSLKLAKYKAVQQYLQYNNIQNGKSPLWSASFNSCIITVQLLLAAGASVDLAMNVSQSKLNILCTHSQDGTTPIMVAAQEGHLSILKLLLSAGVNLHHCSNVSHYSYCTEWLHCFILCQL